MAYLDSTGLAKQIQYIKGYVQSVLGDFLRKDSPALTGTPTAPTAATGTNTNQIATTAFVKGALSNMKPIIISDDTTMPAAVNNGDLWFQLTGDTSIANGETMTF